MNSIGFHSLTSITISASRSAAATPTITSFFPSAGPKPIQSVKNPFQRWSRTNRKYRSRGAQMSAVELKPSIALMSKADEISDALKGTSIFFVGMNCAMKTNLAKVLAEALRYYLFDSDNLVVEAAGGKLDAESFRKTDESEFRDYETEILKQLSSIGRLVVCAGDGAVQSVTNLAYLRYGISIWIDVPLDMLAESASKTVSPIEVQDELSRRYEKLKEGYATADARISVQRLASELGYDDLSTLTPEDLALEVLRQIEKLTRVKKMMEDAARPF